MAHWVTLAICALTTAIVAAQQQQPLAMRPDVVLTDALRHKLSTVLAKHSVPVGYALAIVRPGADLPVEYANWGNATEDGRPMASNVRARVLVVWWRRH